MNIQAQKSIIAPIQLGKAAVGNIVRMYNTTFESAIEDDQSSAFFLVTSEKKAELITLVPLNGGAFIHRTADFPVYQHTATISILKD